MNIKHLNILFFLFCVKIDYAFCHKKLDLIIFSDDSTDLEMLLKQFNTNDLKYAFVIYNDVSNLYIDLKKQFKKFCFLDKNKITEPNIIKIFKNILNNDNEFIMLCNDSSHCIDIKLEDLIKKMEETNTSIMYYLTKNRFLDNSMPSFKFEEYNISGDINSLICKKNQIKSEFIINNIEIEWKYIGWYKHCLFQIINE